MQAILKNHTAGDPMRQDLRWTNLSRRQISRKLYANGIPASKTSFQDYCVSRVFTVVRLRKPKR
ncbi:hypothetical protein D5R81_00635 [Parashewanella spongiae]|uniref:Uncharacterized protein n=1 Tax=Parashewanella spongiae TaxID=342950 RepID=A0A3A6U209_9GAMM|nr:hypothetical protein D5R81_00635 [Parashewanella spongiae]